jgi:thymidylate kinase
MLVAFAGCDGAGKTTQVERVRQWLEERGWQAEIIDRWDILDAEQFPECRFIRSSRNEVRVCNSEMEGLSRAMFLFWTISLTMRKIDLRDQSRVYLLDGYWMKHGAAEIEYGCDPAWVEATVRSMPWPDVTLYLDVTPEDALRRKPDVTPYECARNPDMNPQDFIRHQTKVRRRLLRWANEFGWDVISSMQEPARVTEQIGSLVAGRLRGPRDASYGAGLVNEISPYS